ncbi:MAG: phosphopantetheine-binding protein, partial [Bacteroidota bacterium]
HLVEVERFPLLQNGKIDRKALLQTELRVSTGPDEGPSTEFEQLIHEVWQAVFPGKKIGRNDHFLDLGGESLRGIRIVNRVNETFELNLPANTIFRYPTIAVLATHVETTIRELLAALDKT